MEQLGERSALGFDFRVLQFHLSLDAVQVVDFAFQDNAFRPPTLLPFASPGYLGSLGPRFGGLHRLVKHPGCLELSQALPFTFGMALTRKPELVASLRQLPRGIRHSIRRCMHEVHEPG